LTVTQTTETPPVARPEGWAWRWLRRAGQGLLPFGLALLAGAVVLFLTGKDALGTYARIFEQAFLGLPNLADTLLFSTPLILTGLATAVVFRVGIFSVGVEGSLYFGAFAAAWAGFTFTGLPGWLLVPLAFGLAGLVGAFWSWIPGVLRAYLQVDEVVTTFMLNYIAIFITSYLVNGPFLAKGTANSMSPLVANQARLPQFINQSQLNWAFPLALLLAAVLWWLLRRTTFGFALRLTGDNSRFAAASGIDTRRTIVLAMLLSGLIGGLAGASQILGPAGRFIDNFSPGYGFQGLAVALLAANNPLLVVPAAIFFGALANGGSLIQLFSNIPIDLVNVLQGTVMLFATARLALKWPAIRGVKGGRRV
jgi:general nucleoside transport system permease protein